jgi:uncharacterized protein YceH (UPF0502 family)
LSLNERRVLGVLVEKAKTTPDNYPLSLNGLVNGCNQKSNRDPVLNMTDEEAEEAIAGLKMHGYAQQILGGGRVDKYRHVLYDALKVDKVQLAILAELLLRGPQTEGELRGRASRMEPLADLDALRGPLRQLVQRGLAVWLSPEGRRGALVSHAFLSVDELERFRARGERATSEEPSAEGPAPARRSSADALDERVRLLETALADLRAEVQSLKSALSHGESGRLANGTANGGAS